MKILILTNAYPSEEKPYAGIFVKNQVEELKKYDDLDINIFSIKRSYTGSIGSILKYFNSFFKFIFFVLPRKYAVVHLHFFFPLIWFCVIYKFFHPSSRLIVTCHGSDINQNFNNRISCYIHSQLTKMVDYVQVVGPDLAKSLEIKLKRVPEAIKPAGISHHTFKPLALEKIYDFIFVGTFSYGKGIDLLISAIQKLPKNIRFCFIGSGVFEAQLEGLKHNFNITMKKNLNQEEINEALNQSCYFILPTRYDAFGLVVTEALYCGTPVLVSDIAGMREQVTENKNGYFLKDLTEESVLSLMNQCLSIQEPHYRELSKYALSSNTQFRLDETCKWLKKVYENN